MSQAETKTRYRTFSLNQDGPHPCSLFNQCPTQKNCGRCTFLLQDLSQLKTNHLLNNQHNLRIIPFDSFHVELRGDDNQIIVSAQNGQITLRLP